MVKTSSFSFTTSTRVTQQKKVHDHLAKKSKKVVMKHRVIWHVRNPSEAL